VVAGGKADDAPSAVGTVEVTAAAVEEVVASAGEGAGTSALPAKSSVGGDTTTTLLEES
jgi:hypothetical protein